jgi:glycosyltransferase involved in cell wall biosynthesis
MDYFPNVKGATWFATEVFPSVQKQRPDAVFRIVGSNPIASIQALQSNPGVQVTGSVADVRPLLDDAAISVVPLTLARGTQNKMLECMAMGVPVACTPQAAKGIDAVPGRDFLVASSPQEFSAAILQVINSPDVEQQLATSGRAQVEAAHDWARSMRILDEIVERPAHAKRDLVSQLTR